MVTLGHWWFQHTPTQGVATKPPLAGFISAVIFYSTHSWNAAWRLPSLLSALAILLVLILAGDRLLPQTGGLLAAGVFGLNLMAPRLATLVRTDMLLTLFIFLTGHLVYEKVKTAAPWTSRERWMVFALVLGSMMTKGPIAYAFLLPGLAAFWLLCKRRRMPDNAWSGWWSWFGPLLLFLAWAGIGIWRNDEFYNQVVLKEFLGRFTVGEQAVHKNQPIYFYVTHLLRDFAPWSLLLLALPFIRKVRCGFADDRAALWLICWSLGGLMFMSLVPSKRPDRIFPIVPPLCLLLVHFVRELQINGLRVSRVVPISLALAVVCSGGYTLFNVVNAYRDRDGALAAFGARVREYAAKNDLHYAIASSKDEGMLLYLQQLEFLKLRHAASAWTSGKIDALVLNGSDFKSDAAALRPWFLADETGPAVNKSSRYYLIVRNKEP